MSDNIISLLYSCRIISDRNMIGYCTPAELCPTEILFGYCTPADLCPTKLFVCCTPVELCTTEILFGYCTPAELRPTTLFGCCTPAELCPTESSPALRSTRIALFPSSEVFLETVSSD
jgi:hypothetical protein